MVAQRHLNRHIVYKVGIPSKPMCVCIHALKNVCDIGSKRICALKKHLNENGMNPVTPKNTGNNNRSAESPKTKSTNSAKECILKIAQDEGEPWATKFIRDQTGVSLRECEKDQLYLPPSYAKRKMCEHWCYTRVKNMLAT